MYMRPEGTHAAGGVSIEVCEDGVVEVFCSSEPDFSSRNNVDSEAASILLGKKGQSNSNSETEELIYQRCSNV